MRRTQSGWCSHDYQGLYGLIMSISSEGSSSTLERSLARLDASLDQLRQGREAFEKQQSHILPATTKAPDNVFGSHNGAETHISTSGAQPKSKPREYRADDLLSRVEDSLSSIHGSQEGKQDTQEEEGELYPTGWNEDNDDSPVSLGQLGTLPLNDRIADIENGAFSFGKVRDRDTKHESPSSALTSDSPEASPGSYKPYGVPSDLESLINSGGTSSTGAKSAGASTLRRYGVHIESPLVGDGDDYPTSKRSSSASSSGLVTHTSVPRKASTLLQTRSYNNEKESGSSIQVPNDTIHRKRSVAFENHGNAKHTRTSSATNERRVENPSHGRQSSPSHITDGSMRPPATLASSNMRNSEINTSVDRSHTLQETVPPSKSNRSQTSPSLEEQFQSRKGKSIYAPDVSSNDTEVRSSDEDNMATYYRQGQRQMDSRTTSHWLKAFGGGNKRYDGASSAAPSRKHPDFNKYQQKLSDSYEKERKTIQEQTDQTLSHWEELTKAYNHDLDRFQSDNRWLTGSGREATNRISERQKDAIQTHSDNYETYHRGIQRQFIDKRQHDLHHPSSRTRSTPHRSRQEHGEEHGSLESNDSDTTTEDCEEGFNGDISVTEQKHERKSLADENVRHSRRRMTSALANTKSAHNGNHSSLQNVEGPEFGGSTRMSTYDNASKSRTDQNQRDSRRRLERISDQGMNELSKYETGSSSTSHSSEGQLKQRGRGIGQPIRSSPQRNMPRSKYKRPHATKDSEDAYASLQYDGVPQSDAYSSDLREDIRLLIGSIYDLINEFKVLPKAVSTDDPKNEKAVQASTEHIPERIASDVNALSLKLEGQCNQSTASTNEDNTIVKGKDGRLWVKLPPSISDKLRELAKRQEDREKLSIRHSKDHPVYVHGILRSRQPTTAEVKPSGPKSRKSKGAPRRAKMNEKHLELFLPDRSSTYIPVQWKPSRK